MTLLSLFNIAPPGYLPSALGGLRSHFLHNPVANDITADAELGGTFLQVLLGPTPRDIALAAGLPGPLFVPGANEVPPPVVSRSQAARDPRNYLA